MDGIYNKHYIVADTNGFIISYWSDGPHPDNDITDAICINNQGGYQFDSFPGGEINPNIHTMDGVPLYRWDGESVIPRTEEEIQNDRSNIPAPPPTEMERMRADLDYVMLMNGMDVSEI